MRTRPPNSASRLGALVPFLIRLACGLVIGGLAVSSPGRTLAQGNAPPISQRWVVREDTALRGAPSVESAEQGRLPAGSLVWQVSTAPDEQWREVRGDGRQVTGWIPAAALSEVALLVTVNGVALRAAPALDAAFVLTLPPEREAWAFEAATVDGQEWQHVWAAPGLTGWAPARHFEVYRVIADERLSLRPAAGDGDDPPATLEANTVAVVEEITPDGDWYRLRTPEGGTGWAAREQVEPLPVAAQGQVRLPQAIQNRGANLRSTPSANAPIIGRLAQGTAFPIIGRDHSQEWLLMVTPDGRLAWISRQVVRLPRGAVQSLAVVAPP